MKTDLYTFVHKAHRVRLFNVSVEIGRADFADPADVAKVRALLAKEIEHLRDHAAIEEHYIHPLYKKVGSPAAHGFLREHEDLEKEIETLEILAKEARWPNLHRAYNAFLGHYLLHLDEEEAAQEEILWTQCEDEDLAEVFARFQKERASEKLRDDLELFLPALSAPELARIFTGMKLRAPAPVFEFAQGLGVEMVEPARWEKVKAAVG